MHPDKTTPPRIRPEFKNPKGQYNKAMICTRKTGTVHAYICRIPVERVHGKKIFLAFSKKEFRFCPYFHLSIRGRYFPSKVQVNNLKGGVVV